MVVREDRVKNQRDFFFFLGIRGMKGSIENIEHHA